MNKQIQSDKDQLKFQIYGPAGTGKSYLLESISKLIGNKLLILAKSGKAAVNVKGVTIQSALGIPIKSAKYLSLSDTNLAEKIKKFEEIEYICIDEISLVDKALFSFIDKRLREVKEDKNSLFGNVNIIILGDWAQLPPVKDQPLFTKNGNQKTFKKEGKALFDTFKDCINLNVIMRQN